MRIYVVETINPESNPEPEVFTNGKKAVEYVRTQFEETKEDLQKNTRDSDTGYKCSWEIDENNFCGECQIAGDWVSDVWQWRITAHDIPGSIETNMKIIEEQKQAARNTNELLDHLVNIVERNDDRFSFEFASGGEKVVMEIFDKKKSIGYAVKIEPIEYDENGEAVNL